MTTPNGTRRPTAKQRAVMLEALAADNLQRTTIGLQARTVEAMRVDGWINPLGPDGLPCDSAVATTFALLEQGAAALGQRLEFGNKVADLRAAAADNAIVTGWRYLQLGTEPIAHTGPAADFTHSCDRCRRRFVGVFDTWGDVCGFCRWGTTNALAPHMGGTYPVADGETALPVHAQVPNTVGAACFMARDESTPDGAQQTTNARKVTCDDCLDIDVDALQARRRADDALEAAAGVDERPSAPHAFKAIAGVEGCAAGLVDAGRCCGRPAGDPLHDEPVEVDVPRQRRRSAVDALPEVDPAPGSIDDLLGLVTLYGDERAEAALFTAAAGNYQPGAFTTHAQLAAQHREQIETIARRLLEQPPMTRDDAAKLVDRLVQNVAADVDADAETQSDDTLAAVEAIVLQLAGPEQGTVGAGLVAVPVVAFLEPAAEPVAVALERRTPGASLPAELLAADAFPMWSPFAGDGLERQGYDGALWQVFPHAGVWQLGREGEPVAQHPTRDGAVAAAELLIDEQVDEYRRKVHGADGCPFGGCDSCDQTGREVDAERVAATLADVDAVEQNARVAGDEPGDVDDDAARQNAEVAAQLDRLAADRAAAAAERERAEQLVAEQFPIGTRVTFTEGGRVHVGDVRTIYPGGRALWVVDDAGVGHAVGPRQARPVVTVELPDEPVELSGIAAAAVALVEPDRCSEHGAADHTHAGTYVGTGGTYELVDDAGVPFVEPADPATVPGTPEYAAATMAAAVPTGTPLEQQFVYTFGPAHTGYTGDAFVVLHAADRAAADRAMFARYGDEWAFGYAGDAAVALLTNYPGMRQAQLAPELPRVEIDRLEMGPNGYTLRGANAVALFRAAPIGETGGYELTSTLPGIGHSSESYGDRAGADRAAEYILQKWMRSTLGVLANVVVVDERD